MTSVTAASCARFDALIHPADGHEFQLDFPRLMLRASAVKAAKAWGSALRDKMLGESGPPRQSRARCCRSSRTWACRSPFQRAMMEKMLGISSRQETARSSPAKPSTSGCAHEDCRRARRTRGQGRAVSYLLRQLLQYGAGQSALVRCWQKNGCEMACPTQNCCGMPALDGGDVAFAQKQARANVASLLPLVRQGYRIAAINPTCSLTMRAEYPDCSIRARGARIRCGGGRSA